MATTTVQPITVKLEMDVRERMQRPQGQASLSYTSNTEQTL